MKKLLLLCFTLLLLIGCKKDNDTNKEYSIWVEGFTAFLPDSEYENASVRFLFFKADNGETFKVESKTFDGTISEYQSLKDETFSLLEENKISLTDGTIVSAYKVSSDRYKPHHIMLPMGRYYVCAIYTGTNAGYMWLYSTKYTGKYYEVKAQSDQPSITVVFPCDRNRYGYTKWVTYNEKFDYDFTF